MLRQTFLFLGQLWQLFEVSQILEFLRYNDLQKVNRMSVKVIQDYEMSSSSQNFFKAVINKQMNKDQQRSQTEDLTQVIISYGSYETSLRRVL